MNSIFTQTQNFFASARLVWQRLETLRALAQKTNLTPHLVGGTVRDILLGREFNHDCDVSFTGGSLNVLVAELKKLWQTEILELKAYPEFGTFTFHFKDGLSLDLITARGEVYTYPGALPKVQSGNLQQDLSRRDFTINALAINLFNGDLIDFLGGAADLQNRRLCILHKDSFIDDPTRIFRAARYAARLNFDPEPLADAAKTAAQNGAMDTVSQYRIGTELNKILSEKNCTIALNLLNQWNALDSIVNWTKVLQLHAKTLDSCNNLVVRWSIILQDAPAAFKWFRNFQFSAELVKNIEQILTLKKKLEQTKNVCALPQTPLPANAQTFFDALPPLANWQNYQRWLQSLPLLNGDHLRAMGYQPGEQFKIILNAVAKARFNKKVLNLEQEKKFVIDNFPLD